MTSAMATDKICILELENEEPQEIVDATSATVSNLFIKIKKLVRYDAQQVCY
jgi:hypothetical protein